MFQTRLYIRKNKEIRSRIPLASSTGICYNATMRTNTLNRQAKDSIFRDLFSRKEYLIRLYRELHPEDTTITEDDLNNITINTVLTNGPHNDLGFTARDKLMILGESQATWSPNVIFRLWEYGGESMMNFTSATGLDIYGAAAIDIPDFEAFVIYIGDRKDLTHVSTDKDGNTYISLNEIFFGGREGRPELRARVIYYENVSGILKEYYDFCKIFDKHQKALRDEVEDLETAIKAIFTECEDAGALVDYLKCQRMEVERIMSGLLTQEMVTEMAQRSASIEASIRMARELGTPEDQIRDLLVRIFGISPKYAQNFLDLDPDRNRSFVPLV